MATVFTVGHGERTTAAWIDALRAPGGAATSSAAAAGRRPSDAAPGVARRGVRGHQVLHIVTAGHEVPHPLHPALRVEGDRPVQDQAPGPPLRR